MQTQDEPRILIIDDEETLRAAVKRILENEGFIVQAAANGTEGISFALKSDFDLALIDLKMPDINGIEVLREIRRKKPYTICYIATAYASYDTAIEATKLGADGYILKPFSPEELVSQLRKGLERRKLLLETERLRKEREESLLEVAFERTRLKTIINSIRDGVIVVNREGESVYCNQAALKLLNISFLPIGIPIIEHFPSEIVSLVETNFLGKESQTNSFTIELNTNPDPDKFIEATISPVPQSDNKLAGIVIVLRNITEFKKLEMAKSQFVSMVAHELKAPIAATIGFLDILTKPEIKVDDAQRMDFLKRSHFRLDSLLLMINDLLDISRMEMNKEAKEIKEISFEDILADILLLLKIDIDKKKIQVTFKNSAKKTVIRADQNEIHRLLLNLLSNAVKYNKENGTISIGLSDDVTFIILRVEDTGIGMKPDEHKRLFAEFFRAKNDKTKNIHGTGLGLSIVKRIVDSYNGKIECVSKYGEGSTFTLYFPKINNYKG